MADSTAPTRAWLVSGAVVGLAAVAAALATGLWVLTAVPIGLLFGFFLQKGDLCGASAISEVVLFRDRRKLFGLWVAIVTSMVVFAALDLLGLVKLSPKPLTWLNVSIGGVIFGAGTVFAGGCVSGCLYKSGAGNLNSMAALVGIPFGVALIKTGPLTALNKAMRAHVVKAADGGSVTLSSVTGMPYWGLALAIAIATVLFVLFRRRPDRPSGVRVREGPGVMQRLLFRRWRPWQAGLAIGLLGGLAWLSSAASGRNYALGVTGGVHQVGALAFVSQPKHVYRPAPPAPAKTEAASATGTSAKASPPRQKIVWWLVALVTSLTAGALIAAKASGDAALLPRPPGQTMVAFGGGILVGLGAGIAHGCVVGNIISGIGMLSVGTMLFAVFTVLANWAATYLYLMGGWPGSRAAP